MKTSMSRKGNCYDNAPMESFWGTLKTELTFHRRYASRQEAMSEIRTYIELFYNRQRKQRRLGYLSPAAYEQEHYKLKKQRDVLVSIIANRPHWHQKRDNTASKEEEEGRNLSP